MWSLRSEIRYIASDEWGTDEILHETMVYAASMHTDLNSV